ncbi:MAG: hypothetical protein EZS28_018175 [Streblomastix strix]|uniref:U-box domain-containing protein n=1 Tax=Streblomastix strix TaxID=222440 RepID=A0A5J4VUL3_9EUKA|nr:MAG: hypothetical protein EZS28_018175 [Streblomastix strix]
MQNSEESSFIKRVFLIGDEIQTDVNMQMITNYLKEKIKKEYSSKGIALLNILRDFLEIIKNKELTIAVDHEFIDLFVLKSLKEQELTNKPILRNIFLPIFYRIKEEVEGSSFPDYPERDIDALCLLTYNKHLMSLFSLSPGLLFIPLPLQSPYLITEDIKQTPASTQDGLLHFSINMSFHPPTLFIALLSRATFGPEYKYFSPMHLFFDKQTLNASKELIDNQSKFQLNLNSAKIIAKKFSSQDQDMPEEGKDWKNIVIQRAINAHQLEPRISMSSGIIFIEHKLRELISNKIEQTPPFKFGAETEILYQAIHSLHVGLLPVLNKYYEIVDMKNEIMNAIPMDMVQLSYLPFPSVLLSSERFQKFLQYICEKEEIQQNKKLAHQIIIEDGNIEQINNLLSKKLLSSSFSYKSTVNDIYDDVVKHLHPSFDEAPPRAILKMLKLVCIAKDVIEQKYGYDIVIAYSDLLLRVTKFYDFIAWLLLRQMGEIGGFGQQNDGQYEDDIGYWDCNQENEQIQENEQQQKEVNKFQPRKRSLSPKREKHYSSSISPASDPKHDSAAINSPFLLNHPLVAIQPLLILQDMKQFISLLLKNENTSKLLIHAKNILHLLAFFVLNFRMISHQKDVIELGQVLCEIFSPQIDDDDEDDEDEVDDEDDNDNLFGIPDDEDLFQAMILSQEDQKDSKQKNDHDEKQKQNNNNNLIDDQLKMCYQLYKHPPLFYLFPRSLLTFFPYIENVPNDEVSQTDKLDSRIDLAISLKQMLNDDIIRVSLIQLLWKGCENISLIQDDYNNDINGANSYMLILPRISNDIMWLFKHSTDLIEVIIDKQKQLKILKILSGKDDDDDDEDDDEEEELDEQKKSILKLKRVCVCYLIKINELFNVLITLIRVGPICKFESQSFTPIVKILNDIVILLTDKDSQKKWKIDNPQSIQWDPLNTIGLIFDTFIALAKYPPQTCEEVLSQQKQTAKQLRRSKSPPPISVGVDIEGNYSQFIVAVNDLSVGFNYDAFNRICDIIQYKQTRSAQLITLYRRAMITIQKQAENSKESEFDKFLEDEIHKDGEDRDLIDPILDTLIRDAVHVLQGDKYQSFDRKSVMKLIINNQKNPFTNESLTLDMIKPDIELQKKVDAYIAKKKIEFEQLKKKE